MLVEFCRVPICGDDRWQPLCGCLLSELLAPLVKHRLQASATAGQLPSPQRSRARNSTHKKSCVSQEATAPKPLFACGGRMGRKERSAHGAPFVFTDGEGDLSSREWKQRKKPSSFDCLGEVPLMFPAGAGAFRRHNFGVSRDKLFEGFRVFVVNILKILRAEKTRLGFFRLFTHAASDVC